MTNSVKDPKQSTCLINQLSLKQRFLGAILFEVGGNMSVAMQLSLLLGELLKSPLSAWNAGQVGQYITPIIANATFPLVPATGLATKPEHRPESDYLQELAKQASGRKKATAWAMIALTLVVTGLDIWSNVTDDANTHDTLKTISTYTKMNVTVFYWAMNWLMTFIYRPSQTMDSDGFNRLTMSEKTKVYAGNTLVHVLGFLAMANAIQSKTVQTLAQDQPGAIAGIFGGISLLALIFSKALQRCKLTEGAVNLFRLYNANNTKANHDTYRNTAILYNVVSVTTLGLSLASLASDAMRNHLHTAVLGVTATFTLTFAIGFWASLVPYCQCRGKKANGEMEQSLLNADERQLSADSDSAPSLSVSASQV